MISIADVAKKAGVSIATVSRVLNAPEKVRPDTRDKVLLVMEQLNYRPNPLAQGIRRNSSGVIGMLMPGITPSFGRILAGVVAEAAQNGQSVIVSPAYWNEQQESEAIANLVDKPVDGIIYLPRHVGIPLPKLEAFRDLPIVGVGRRTLGFDAPCVYSDNEKSGYLATKYLLSIGRERLAFAAGLLLTDESMSRAAFEELVHSPHAGAYIATDRFRGYLRALREAGREYDSELLFINGFSGQAGELVAQEILSAGANVDGVIAANDNSAVGMIKTFVRQGYDVPRDISVIGFDDIYIAEQSTPALTTIHQQLEGIGTAAMRLINRLLAGEKEVEDVKIDVSLITRESTVRKNREGSPQ